MQEADRHDLIAEEKLKLESFEARQGADDVVSRLTTELTIGAPSIADLAYAIRARVKDDYKIVDKVLRKRESDDAYGVSNLRDIVGLRIVTLYRLDALTIIPRLLSMIQHDGSEEHALFLPDSLEEIIVYSTNPQGDAQALPQRLKSLFESHGLGEKAKIDGTPSNYTSIHMVAWCRGRYKDSYKDIPIEIQVRTALEDVWSEIDHQLKYKPGGRHLTVREEATLQGCLTHLNVMKSFIDGSAQYADQIKVQEQLVTARRFVSTTHRTVEDTISIVRNMQNLPVHVRTLIEHGVEQQYEAVDASRQGAAHSAERTGALRNAIQTLKNASVEIEQSVKDQEVKQRLLDYYLPMEIALCHFQLGSELGSDDELKAAIRLYEVVNSKHEDKAVVAYRYGRALSAIGDRKSAIEKMSDAQRRLENDPSIPSDHWVRSSIPRNLGVYYWEIADEIRQEDKPESGSGADWRDNYLKAYEVTHTAYDLKVEPHPQTDNFDKHTSYKGAMANNLLYYAIDYLEVGGSIERLKEFGYSDQSPQEFLGQMLSPGVGNIDVPEVLHTVILAIKWHPELADFASLPEVKKRLRQLLSNLGVVDQGGRTHEEEMLRLANEGD